LGKILGKDSGVRVDLLIFDYEEAMKAGRRALGMDSGFERPKMIRCLLDSWLP
jgi:hypothetical protein